MLRGARFSPNRVWRYSLTRDWLTGSGNQLMIMLNPSRACELYDDATTTLMVRRAQRDGFQRYEAVNLFALVATDPKRLNAHPDPVGPETDFYIRAALARADRIIVAWGNGGGLNGRDKDVLELIGGRQIWCFGVTKTGQPKFPRAIPRNAVLQRFAPARPTTAEQAA